MIEEYAKMLKYVLTNIYIYFELSLMRIYFYCGVTTVSQMWMNDNYRSPEHFGKIIIYYFNWFFFQFLKKIILHII